MYVKYSKEYAYLEKNLMAEFILVIFLVTHILHP